MSKDDIFRTGGSTKNHEMPKKNGAKMWKIKETQSTISINKKDAKKTLKAETLEQRAHEKWREEVRDKPHLRRVSQTVVKLKHAILWSVIDGVKIWGEDWFLVGLQERCHVCRNWNRSTNEDDDEN